MEEFSVNVRLGTIECTKTWSSIEQVASAIVVASTGLHWIYVERRGTQYRWSFAHSGGGYPLLRVVAQYLGVDHRRLIIGFRTLENGIAILCEDPDVFDEPGAFEVVPIAVPLTVVESNAILATL